MHVLNLQNNVLLLLTSSNNNMHIYFKETGVNSMLCLLWQVFSGGQAAENIDTMQKEKQ